MHLISPPLVGIARKASQGLIPSGEAACENIVLNTVGINQAEKLAPYTRGAL